MAKIPLTIDANYAKSWSFWEGIREVISNAKDADEYDGCVMHVGHNARSAQLIVTSEGVSISAATLLLLGRSTKGSGEHRGRFGEGFCVGMLALVRAGHPVRIENGDEAWMPAIERAEEGPFAGEELLIFTTRKLRSARKDFTIEIDNVSKEVWDVTKRLFLFLAPPSDIEQVKLPSGVVLLEESRQGRVFSKGVFVCEVEDLSAGYDLNNLQLDRDRRMVDEWDLRSKLAELWNEAHAAAPEKFAPKVYEMAKRGSPETKSLSWRADAGLLKALHQEFEKEHGEGSIPVSDMSESRELDALGAKTVMVDRTLKEMLEKTTQPATVVREKLRSAVRTRFSTGDLTEAEASACRTWVEHVTNKYTVVEFNNEDSMARADHEDVFVARKLLLEDPRTITRYVAKATADRDRKDLAEVYLDMVFGAPA